MRERHWGEAIERVRAFAAEEAEEILREAAEQVRQSEMDFRQTELEIRDRVLALGGQLLEQALTLCGRGYEGARRDCSCGRRQEFVSYREKRLTTLLSEISLERAYYHCRCCGRSWIPSDHRLDVVGTGFSPALRQAVAWLGAEVAFDKSRELVSRLCGITISKQRIEDIAEGFGGQIEHFQPRDPRAKPRRGKTEDLYVEVDGTSVHLQEGWKEVKVGTIFWGNVDPEGSPIRGPTTYLGRFTDADHFGQEVWETVQPMRPDRARRKIVLGDGAPWIWAQADLHFPEAIQIVDWYHATDHLWQVARAVFGENSRRVRPWVEARKTELWNSDVEAVIKALGRLRPQNPSARDTVRQNKNYFQNHRERMRYRHFRNKGLFIGSGVVEASCKHVVAERLKKSGMRWSKPGASKVLNLRLSIMNNQWDNFWQWRQEQLREAA